MSLFHASILTIFPEMFPGILDYSLAGRALKQDIWSYNVINIRDFGRSKHKNVDDEAYGGGDGLIMRPDVLGDAIDHALKLNPNSKLYYPSPRGNPLNQKLVKDIINNKKIIILCGRFEGVDERIIEEYNATEISMGDYVLSGGEIAAFAILDSCIRLLPGVLVNQKTLEEESFVTEGELSGLLEYPLYTRPAIWKERKVPDVLLSGNHAEITEWKRNQSQLITKLRRPDLLR